MGEVDLSGNPLGLLLLFSFCQTPQLVTIDTSLTSVGHIHFPHHECSFIFFINLHTITLIVLNCLLYVFVDIFLKEG